MNGITRVLAKELGPQNIRVNSINPWRRRHRGRVHSATNSSPNRMSHLHVTPSTDEHRVSPGRQTNMCPFLRR